MSARADAREVVLWALPEAEQQSERWAVPGSPSTLADVALAALRAAVGGGPVVIMEDGALWRVAERWGEDVPVLSVRPVVESSAAAPEAEECEGCKQPLGEEDDGFCRRCEDSFAVAASEAHLPAPAVPSTPEDRAEQAALAMYESCVDEGYSDYEAREEAWPSEPPQYASLVGARVREPQSGLVATVVDGPDVMGNVAVLREGDGLLDVWDRWDVAPVAAPARSSGAPTPEPCSTCGTVGGGGKVWVGILGVSSALVACPTCGSGGT